MAKEYIVVKNGRQVVARLDSKQLAQAAAEELRDENPRASYEFGKLDKRLYTTKSSAVYTPAEEAY